MKALITALGYEISLRYIVNSCIISSCVCVYSILLVELWFMMFMENSGTSNYWDQNFKAENDQTQYAIYIKAQHS